VADLIVILTEQALGDGDAQRIVALHDGEELRYHVLVPADTERNLLVDVIDHLSMLELRKALDAVRGREPSDDQARLSASDALAASLTALRGTGVEADGEVTADDPLPAVQQSIDSLEAREVVVVTRPHAMEDTFHRDWASRARDELGVPVLHVYAGPTFLG
jgi:hypothetical protein